MNSKDWVVVLNKKLRRDIFIYYLQSTDKVTILDDAQSRKYAFERTYNDLTRQIRVADPSITPEAANSQALQALQSEDKEYQRLNAGIPNNVARLVALKATAQALIDRLPPSQAKRRQWLLW